MILKRTARLLKEKGVAGIVERGWFFLRNGGLGIRLAKDPVAYRRWLKEYHELTPKVNEKIFAEIKGFDHLPFFSVIMPTYNTKSKWLTEAIESVRNQLYDKWELCIADDASTHGDTLELLSQYQKADQRIKVVFRETTGHISEASNSAIAIATGDWLCLLDHDDLLPADALFRVAKAINQNPDAALVYSDEDKIDHAGQRFDPYFKCDWNYALFLSHNLISHLGAYRTDIIKSLGGFRKGFEGSQDYDLALRFIEQIDHSQIIHIPKVLYHWRIHHESTASSPDNKPYAVISAQKAISEHLQRKGVNASVEILPVSMFRVRYQLPQKLPLVSIIIPTRNNKQLLKNCIDSLVRKTTYPQYEIVLVDNGSDDPETLSYQDRLKNKRHVLVIHDDRPFNFSAINNHAADKAQGSLICFLNDDTEVISDNWLGEMVSIALQEKVAVVGAKLWYPDGTLQHGGVVLGIGGIASHAHKGISMINRGYFNRAILLQEFSAVTGACMMVDKSLFEQLNGFDETDLGVAYNDVDFCLRARAAGYRVVWTPYAELMHHESATRGDDQLVENKPRFEQETAVMLQRWGHLIQLDPFYSPNLTLAKEDFTMAWPPRLDYP